MNYAVLEQWQKKYGVSNFKLANFLGVHPSLITHIKKGRRNWTPKMAEAMEVLSGGEIPRLQLLYPNQDTKKSKRNTILKRIWKFLFSTNEKA